MPEDSTSLEEFPSPRDRAFGDTVLDMGLAGRGVVEEALGLQVRYAFSGKEVPSLPQLLVGRGLITRKQAGRALAKLAEDAGDSPGLAPDADFSETSKQLPALDDGGSLDEGPRIIMPASALKEPDPGMQAPTIEPPAAPTKPRDKPRDKEPADEEAVADSTKLPEIRSIQHVPDEPLDTGTVEIIMPVGGDTTVKAPAKSKPRPEPPAARPPHPVPATKTKSSEPISGYKLLARVSVDETGTIFKAQQIAMDRLVALKILPPKMTADRSFVDSFLKEARDAGQLNHPNLVRVHEVGRTGNYYFYSMELVEGQNLEQNIKLGGRMQAARALQVTTEVCKAIEHMASKDLIHGEISPEAVVITNEGAVKVLLAGLGRSRSDNTRFLVGDRYHYVAPERALSEHFDVRADLYSAGATLHYALTGQHPYTGSNANEVLGQHFTAAVPNPKEVLADLAADVAKVVTKAMAKNRTERFAGPAEMISAIEEAIAAAKPRRPRGTRQATRATRNTTTGTKAVRLKRRRRRKRR